MRVIAIEEHWTTDSIDQALRAQPTGARDPSLVLNDRGDTPARLFDIGERRVEAMEAAGIDLQILSIAPPGAHGLPAREAVALSRDANDRASAAVDRYPTRFRAMTTLPMSDPDAALDELQRTADAPAHVGVMSYGRSGDRPLDNPVYDELLAAAASLRRPVFIHPQIPVAPVREASYSGFGPAVDLSLATFGWGWHMEAEPPEAVIDRLSALLPDGALDEAVKDLKPDELSGPGGLLSQLAGRVIQAALEAEMTEHLGHEPGGTPAASTFVTARPRRRSRPTSGRSRSTRPGTVTGLLSPNSSPSARPGWRAWTRRSSACMPAG